MDGAGDRVGDWDGDGDADGDGVRVGDGDRVGDWDGDGDRVEDGDWDGYENEDGGGDGGCSMGPSHHFLLIPGRTSAICALVTNQRVKEQMEPGLGAVPATLRTLRQHIANVPQVSAGVTLLCQGKAV